MSEPALSSMMANRLTDKLARVDASMEAITSVSKLMSLNYGEKSGAAAALWWSAMQRAHPKQLLTFMYVANDVMQNTKKRGPAFVNAFCPFLGKALRLACAKNAALRPKLKRLIDVWQQRKIVSGEYIAGFHAQLLGVSVSDESTSSSRSRTHVEESSAQPSSQSERGSDSPGTPPGSPPADARLRSKVILQSRAAALSRNASRVAFLDSGDDDDDDDDDDDGLDDNHHNSKIGQHHNRSSNGGMATGDTDDAAAAGGIADALMYNEAVELMLGRLAKRFRAIEGDSLFDRTTIPRHLTRGSPEERRMRDQILANAGVLKQLKHELEQKGERSRSMLTMLALEMETQSESIAGLEREMESIDDTLALLDRLKTIAAQKQAGGKSLQGARTGVLRLKRLKSHLVNNAQRTAVNIKISDLRDDLKDLDNEDDEDLSSEAVSAAALARKRRRAQYKRQPKKKPKKKEVPMVWNRALRAYVPVNIDGSDAAWMSY